MRSLADTITRLKRLPRGVPNHSTSLSRLRELDEFGSNPGQLKAFLHVPDGVANGAPLVVVLHGCTQNASGYDENSGWSRLADQHGFILLYPEQQRSNNPNLCFNWFSPADVGRGKGEALSVRQMVDAVQALHKTDPDRVFVTGLSAGGAMAAAMLATYPDVFASGAVIAGLPFGVARSVPEAFDRMRGHNLPDAGTLSRLVRDASDHSGKWPTLSVWHGTADLTVDPSNASALVEQWRSLHGAPAAPALTEFVRGNPHRVWIDANGSPVVEEYRITGLGHGTPLDPSGSGSAEHAAPFMLAAGVSSTRLIAQYWKLVPSNVDATVAQAPVPAEQRCPRAASVQNNGGHGINITIGEALRRAGLIK